MYLIDRRKNPKGKNLTNSQRFLEKIREQIKASIDASISENTIKELSNDGEVSTKNLVIVRENNSTREPSFTFKRNSGKEIVVLPGNLNGEESLEFIESNDGGILNPYPQHINHFLLAFKEGDTINKPEDGEGGGGRGGSPSGLGEDDFMFYLSKEEWTKYLFENLEIPNIIEKDEDKVKTVSYARAGYTISGSPNNISLKKTLKNGLGRRISLARPKNDDLVDLEHELENKNLTEEERSEILVKIESIKDKMTKIPYIDPVDVRYNNFTPTPKPNFKAVVFFLMDVSGSMGESEKDLSKRFFVLLYRFLRSKYESVDIVFIRHTSEAKVVDEEEFFYSKETGGTIVSSALEETMKVINAKYPRDIWNIYVAQATDGDNYQADDEKVQDILVKKLLPLSQYYIYLEIKPENSYNFDRKSNLYRMFENLKSAHDNLDLKVLRNRKEIYLKFKEIFSPKGVKK